MFKKSLFLGLALTISGATASADCLSVYEEFLYKNQKGLTFSGALFSTAIGGAASASKGSKLDGGPQGAIAGLAGVGSISMANMLENLFYVSDVVNLIKDAKLGKGFYLDKLSSSEVMNYTSIRSTKAIAQAINNLNNRNAFCEKGIIKEEKFYQLIIAEISSNQ